MSSPAMPEGPEFNSPAYRRLGAAIHEALISHARDNRHPEPRFSSRERIARLAWRRYAAAAAATGGDRA